MFPSPSDLRMHEILYIAHTLTFPPQSFNCITKFSISLLPQKWQGETASPCQVHRSLQQGEKSLPTAVALSTVFSATMYSRLYKPSVSFFLFGFHLHHRGGSRLHVGFPQASTIRSSWAPQPEWLPAGKGLRQIHIDPIQPSPPPASHFRPLESQGCCPGNAVTARQCLSLPPPQGRPRPEAISLVS